ncbi:MAG: sigma-70 family RNA polymerase sigma factor [Candidatus Omnitrophica bacterium]|nr:sigma-70 family RNA polymerase sigma factor [Candidatus Omnitrophota bacterium]
MSNSPEKPKIQSTDPELWVDAYGNYLYHFALSRLRNTTEAENVVQETFLAALKARDSFSGRSTERTWLIGILKHKIIDVMRKGYREKPVSDLQKNEEAIDQFFDHAGHPKKDVSKWIAKPDELLEKKEFWHVFYKCSEKLPKTTADAFLLREIEKMDSTEICSILKITSSNLWVLLHRARLQLRECLEINWFNSDENKL